MNRKIFVNIHLQFVNTKKGKKPMPTMRTIDQAIAQIKMQDNGSCLTKHALRKFITNEQIPYVRCGKKYLINLETLESFLQGSTTPKPHKEGIRKVGESIRN